MHIDILIQEYGLNYLNTYRLLVEHGKANEKLEYNVTYILISILYIYMYYIRSDSFNAGYSL